VDLLEYMRSQNNMTQAEWERIFEDEAREILVLLAGGGGAGKRSGFWDVSHYFIAYVGGGGRPRPRGGGGGAPPQGPQEDSARGSRGRDRLLAERVPDR